MEGMNYSACVSHITSHLFPGEIIFKLIEVNSTYLEF